MAQDPLEVLRSALPANYTVDSYIARGGEGAVFKGTAGGAPAAIKLFAPDANPDRIEREIDILRKIDCPYLVRIVDSTNLTIQGVKYPVVAYEYISGGDLVPLAEASARPTQEELVKIGAHVALAVQALWQRKIVHRDIKPANILRGQDRFILADVGLARHLDLKSLTAVGRIVGTEPYMSPEQAKGRRKLTSKSDAFSLGVTLFHLASGQHPWGPHRFTPGLTQISKLAPMRPDLSLGLLRLVERLLAVRPYERPGNIVDLFNRLGA